MSHTLSATTPSATATRAYQGWVRPESRHKPISEVLKEIIDAWDEYPSDDDDLVDVQVSVDGSCCPGEQYRDSISPVTSQAPRVADIERAVDNTPRNILATEHHSLLPPLPLLADERDKNGSQEPDPISAKVEDPETFTIDWKVNTRCDEILRI